MTVRTSSIAAYQTLKESGELGERQQLAFQLVKKYGPSTTRELHKKLIVEEGVQEASLEGPNYIQPRLNELREMGLIEEINRRECSVTGRQAMVLAVADK